MQELLFIILWLSASSLSAPIQRPANIWQKHVKNDIAGAPVPATSQSYPWLGRQILNDLLKDVVKAKSVSAQSQSASTRKSPSPCRKHHKPQPVPLTWSSDSEDDANKSAERQKQRPTTAPCTRKCAPDSPSDCLRSCSTGSRASEPPTPTHPGTSALPSPTPTPTDTKPSSITAQPTVTPVRHPTGGDHSVDESEAHRSPAVAQQVIMIVPSATLATTTTRTATTTPIAKPTSTPCAEGLGRAVGKQTETQRYRSVKNRSSPSRTEHAAVLHKYVFSISWWSPRR